MKWFENMKVSVKLLGGFIAVALIGTLIGVIGVINLKKLEDSGDRLYTHVTIPISDLVTISTEFQMLRVNVRDLVQATTPEERKKLRDKLQANRDAMTKASESFQKTILTKEGQAIFDEYVHARGNYAPVFERLEGFALDGKKAEAYALMNGEVVALAKAENDAIAKMVDMKRKVGRSAKEADAALSSFVTKTIIAVTIIGLIVAIVFGIFISRMISVPLKKGVDFASAVAKGDLMQKIDVARKDEIGQLSAAMNDMVDKLKLVTTDVKTAADNVASGSQQLSAGSEQMSQGTTEQAAAAEEASSSVEEMNATIKQNSENAQQTEKIALKSADDAKESGKAVTETVEAMKNIASKIAIIEEIARQTNLLALNAAIEAARAGEHGKGFAVVASEVRKLAERSQVAAAEISTLSTNSVEVAEKAGEMLTKLVPDIQKTAELVQEINAASKEQSSGSDQINSAIQQLNQVIQQNAGAAEEMASTAEELSSQSEQLLNTISFFKIDNSAEKNLKLGTRKKIEDTSNIINTNKEIAKIPDAGIKMPVRPQMQPAGAVISMHKNNGDSRDAEFEKF